MDALHPKARHVLMVEDNDAHAELLVRGLHNPQGTITVRHVSDGEQALDYLFLRGAYQDPADNPRPDLVLLDLRLPRVDGIEVLRTIKTTPSLLYIPVIVLTSSDADRDIALSFEHHANSYLVKPHDIKKITRLMNDVGTYWLGWNTRPRGETHPGAGRSGTPELNWSAG